MNDSTDAILAVATFALCVVLYVWYALALSALFAKAGERTWKAWVPLVNLGAILKLGGFSPWLVLLNLVPFFGLIAFMVVFIVAVHRINVGFDRGAGMTVLGALLQVVWASVLGFGGARWQGTPAAARRAVVEEDSLPARRSDDFSGPYVPLVGGWTPEPPVARSSDLGASAEAPPSAPSVLPFAAPSGSLADAVPAEVDWAPTRSGDLPSLHEPAGPSRAGGEDAVPSTSVFDVLDALRADAGDDAPARRRTTDAEPLPRADENGYQPTIPLTPGVPLRSRVSPGASGPSSSDVETPSDAETPSDVETPSAAADEVAAASAPDLTPWVPPRRASTLGEHAPSGDAPLTRAAVDPVPSAAPASDEVGVGAEEFPELSEAVSAVSGAPDAGAPRSARTSVAALYTQPEFGAGPAEADEIEALDRTVVARRRRIPWALVPPSGDAVDLTSSVVIVGRRPAPDGDFPDAQLVAISDETRTVSKTHARLQLRGDVWFVTDLNSTNGVLFATLMGTEVEAPPGEEIEAGERFFLGDAEVRLSRRDA